MKTKQQSLIQFFKKTRKAASSSESSSGSDSSFELSKKKRKFQVPMSWTWVREVYRDSGRNVTLFDIDEDLKQDRIVKSIRKGISRDSNSFLFDPTTFATEEDKLKIEIYRLQPDELTKHAQLCNTIRE
jgi:hypothetical protein